MHEKSKLKCGIQITRKMPKGHSQQFAQPASALTEFGAYICC